MLSCNYSSALLLALLAVGACFTSCNQASNPEPVDPGRAALAPEPSNEPAAVTPTPAETTAAPSEEAATADAPDDTAASNSETARPPQPPETRTVAVVQDVFLKNRQAVRDCYEQGLKKDPALRGDLVVHFVLSSRGKLKQVELNRQRSTLLAPDVVECALGVISKLEFPPSSRHLETEGNYPFNFVP